MKRNFLRVVGFLGVSMLIAGLVALEWKSSPAKINTTSFQKQSERPSYLHFDPERARSNRTIKLPQGKVQVSAKGMDAVEDVDLKYPWNTQLLERLSSTVNSIKSELLPGMVAPNVYYLWCGKDRWFEFKHYLSVISATKVLKLDKIVLLYDYRPALDKMYYNLWYSDLLHDLPFFIEKPMEDWQKAYCSPGANSHEKLQIIMQVLNGEGGIFLTENTWLLNFYSGHRLLDMHSAYDLDSGEGYIMLRKGFFNPNISVDAMLSMKNEKVKLSQCSRIHHIYVAPDLGLCTVLKGGKYERIWPMDIWELDDPFGKLTRKIFYGTEEIRKPEPSYDTLVPNIAHMVWIGGGRMDFVFYLSVLSLLYVANVDTVYIHGDVEPAGEYWQEVKNDLKLKERVLFITRVPPYQIYQGVVEPWYRALMSDLIRVDLMIKYGGIYTDTDAIWSKPLNPEDLGYDAVASFDWVDWSWPYPDSVNFGISYGKKNAPFWQIFRESMRHLNNEHHGFTGVMMPYKLLERYPHLLRIDRHLQAICYYSKCHPIWVNDYHNMTIDHTNTHSLDNWHKDLTAFHWTHPNPKEFANLTTLMNSEGIFADLGKFVLKKAGKLS